MDKSLIINCIQRSCFDDGPGIRTTVFLHSCSIRCPWCANPESSMNKEKYVVNSNCQKIENTCAYNLVCQGKESKQEILEKNFFNCPVGAIEKTFQSFSIKEIEKKVLEDKFLYGEDGGVTFSGGEPLLQSKNLKVLLKSLKKKEINIAIESCLFVKENNLLDILEETDLFIVDLKVLNNRKSIQILNGDINQFLNNLQIIFDNKKEVIFRIPLINPYVTNKENLKEIYKLLTMYKPLKVELFKGHNLAKEKYLKLGIPYEMVETISDEEIRKIKEKVEKLNIKVEIMYL